MIRSHTLSIAVVGILSATAAACSRDPVSESEPSALVLESLKAGSGTSCGLTATHDLYCWGESPGTVMPVDSSAACTDLTSWRRCNPRPTLVPTGLEFHEISIANGGIVHICGRTAAGEMYCWGDMLVTYDQVVSVGRTPTLRPLADPIEAIRAGDTHDCALTTGGDMYCWGDYDYNVRGTGGPVEHDWDLVPNIVAGGWRFQGLAVGFVHSCGLATNGEALCWGHESSVGVLDPPIRTGGCGLPLSCVDHPVRVTDYRQFGHLEAGPVTCGIDGIQRLYCWGFNRTGAIGDGTTIDRVTPVHIDLPGGVTTVAVGGSHTCATTTLGITYCWGDNHQGHLGTGRSEEILPSPTEVLTPVALRTLAAGGRYTCGLDASGGAWCWGFNDFGQLGTGDTVSSHVPVRVAPPHR